MTAHGTVRRAAAALLPGRTGLRNLGNTCFLSSVLVVRPCACVCMGLLLYSIPPAAHAPPPPQALARVRRFRAFCAAFKLYSYPASLVVTPLTPRRLLATAAAAAAAAAGGATRSWLRLGGAPGAKRGASEEAERSTQPPAPGQCRRTSAVPHHRTAGLRAAPPFSVASDGRAAPRGGRRCATGAGRRPLRARASVRATPLLAAGTAPPAAPDAAAPPPPRKPRPTSSLRRCPSRAETTRCSVR